jgi:hypothetical protein
LQFYANEVQWLYQLGNSARLAVNINERMTMSKKNGKISGGAADVKHSDGVEGAAPEGGEAKAPAAPKSRGPRGTVETAKITLVAKSNPKRPNSKAFAAFANYRDGMTIAEFADAVGKEATGHLVYDAKHGSITIEGYDPGAIIVPKPKAEKKVKAPKDPAKAADAASVAGETATETMD